ncbi:MAG: helix-turn-helix domain-containing protein [Anaerolineales bacterium]
MEDEVAAYLRIPRSSAYQLAHQGRFPCQKAGRQWRFHRDAIICWLANDRPKTEDVSGWPRRPQEGRTSLRCRLGRDRDCH